MCEFATGAWLLIGILTPGLVFAQDRTPRQAAGSQEGMGAVYVPLDSWIYPALKRLAALGFIPGQPSDLGPFTRDECRNQVRAAAVAASETSNPEALKLIADLRNELDEEGYEAKHIRLESVYTRSTGILGTPLNDGYHFGQTITNDFGRPYARGFNEATGFSAYAGADRVFGYFRGEYQHAPGAEGYSGDVRQFISRVDGNPVQGAAPLVSTNRMEALEAYVGVHLGFETISFGKQDLWWGPGTNSAFNFSSNAEPFYSLRFSQTTPLVLPGPLAHLGKIRTEIIFGKLSGHQWPPRPFINAQKISIDLTDNLELGFTRSSIFGGAGHPVTAGSLVSSLFSINSSGIAGYDPGDRHSGFDFRYRIPGLRRYVTVYSDSFADDEPNPLANPKRSAWAPGIYLSQIPGLPGLDLRFETYATWLYRQDEGGGFLYYNGDYHDSYTNKGSLLGSWIGRDARAYVASSRYWFTARSTVEVRYRQVKSGPNFLPGGGTQTDGAIIVNWSPAPDWQITATAQCERYLIPVLGPVRRDALGSLQIMFTPQKLHL